MISNHYVFSGGFKPVWIAFVLGLLVGWIWRPKLVTVIGHKLSCCVSNFLDSSSAKSGSNPPDSDKLLPHDRRDDRKPSLLTIKVGDSSTSRINEERSRVASLITEEDLKKLYQLTEAIDGGPSWIQMMDRTNPTMSYQAWRREPRGGPPQYRTKTVFEDACSETVRDFLWDVDFRVRSKWDDMMVNYNIIDECSATGTMLVQWIRKYPFFCSDREYIAGRRIWESGKTFYCVTKGVPCSSIPKRDKPRRVDLYFSSWRIRAVESMRGDGRLTACEVLLFHYEEMGIPWEIAKIGVKQGMWGTVKKIEPGLRAYQKARASGAELSRPACMAQINSKITPESLKSMGENKENSDAEVAATPEKTGGISVPKLLVIGGAIVVALRIGNMGKR